LKNRETVNGTWNTIPAPSLVAAIGYSGLNIQNTIFKAKEGFLHLQGYRDCRELFARLDTNK